MTSPEEPDAPASDGTPWPRPDSNLLGEGPEWWLVACMDWPRDRWLGYVGGYWKAADVIFERVVETGRDQDMLVYPYLMCWRYFVELQLKNLILLSRRYLRESIELPRTHRLDVLWRVVRQYLERAWPDDDHHELDGPDGSFSSWMASTRHLSISVTRYSRTAPRPCQPWAGSICPASTKRCPECSHARRDGHGLAREDRAKNEIEAEYAAWSAW